MNSEANSASKRVLLAAGVLALCTALPAHAHDYPTADRVVYVQECMRQHPGPHFEMLNKCSCALDVLAGQLPFDDFVQMSTASNANSIGGERGNTIRDTELLQVQIRRFRQLQSAAKKSCFIAGEPGTR
ncbi:hypothetical protein [Piscinibacter sp.]|jgi:hypothetical protein|uniref:hypothetical protein n=1 Tax=Piscinibacter sp. TaxID=1903157 RepID=UPI002F3E762F